MLACHVRHLPELWRRRMELWWKDASTLWSASNGRVPSGPLGPGSGM